MGTEENHNWQTVKGSKTLHSVCACQVKHRLLSGGRTDVCVTICSDRVYSDMTATPKHLLYEWDALE